MEREETFRLKRFRSMTLFLIRKHAIEMIPRLKLNRGEYLDNQNTIAIHKREWSRIESIERIASRFFIIGEESTGRFSWVVEARPVSQQ